MTRTLNKDTEVQEIRFPAGSILGFDENNRLWRCHISAETIIESSSIPCKADTEVEFHSNGNLAACIPARDCEAGKLHIAGNALTLFHENSTVFRCVLAKNIKLGRVFLRVGSEISLFQDGSLSSYWAGPDEEAVTPIALKVNTQVWLYPGGGLKAGFLRQNTILYGIPCKKETMVWFYENNMLAGCTISCDTTVQEISLKSDTISLFHENGFLREGVLSEDLDIGDDDILPGGDTIRLTKDGDLEGTLLTDNIS